MEKIITFSIIVITILGLIIKASKAVIYDAYMGKWFKIIDLSVSHFLIYCLLQYAYGFIKWTIRLEKYNQYPYKNPFCILVIIYCIISFIILGIYYIKHIKDEYGIAKTILFLFAIHIIAILLVMLLSPFNYFF